MSSLADCQKIYDEISAIRNAAKLDYSISNDRKREISIQFTDALAINFTPQWLPLHRSLLLELAPI